MEGVRPTALLMNSDTAESPLSCMDNQSLVGINSKGSTGYPVEKYRHLEIAQRRYFGNVGNEPVHF